MEGRPHRNGNFYHAALDGFSRLAKREKGYPEVPPERVRQMTEEAIAPLYDELMNGPMGDSDRSLARYDQAKSAVLRATEVITRHLAAGSFRLDRTEAAFGTEKGLPPIVLCLPDGREIMLRGRIDRIDRWDHEGTVYFRVIDYKSSEQALEAAKTWWGLQLQLLLYLEVCTAAEPGSKPAGAFYFYVADPLVETATDAAEAVESEMRRLFRLRASPVRCGNSGSHGQGRGTLRAAACAAEKRCAAQGRQGSDPAPDERADGACPADSRRAGAGNDGRQNGHPARCGTADRLIAAGAIIRASATLTRKTFGQGYGNCPICPCRSFGTCWNQARNGFFGLFMKNPPGQVAIPRGIMYNSTGRERRTALANRENSRRRRYP